MYFWITPFPLFVYSSHEFLKKAPKHINKSSKNYCLKVFRTSVPLSLTHTQIICKKNVINRKNKQNKPTARSAPHDYCHLKIEQRFGVVWCHYLRGHEWSKGLNNNNNHNHLYLWGMCTFCVNPTSIYFTYSYDRVKLQLFNLNFLFCNFSIMKIV
jgi:hypothetical protein